jgi:predicted acetyltransferase
VAKHQIHIRDLAWLTPSAYQAIWSYFSRIRLAELILWDMVPPDDPLPHLLLEPRMLNLASGDGLLARIVDLDKAMIQRPYCSEGELIFEIYDDLCPWNANRWRLETSGAQSAIQVTTKDPEVAMPISTLAMLLFGQISASQAARMGRLEVNKKTALVKWDALLRTKYRPFCADFF